MTDSAPPHDSAALERLHRFGGAKLLSSMIELFGSNGSERLSAATAGLASSDAEAVRLAVHSLKSSAAQLGAMKLSGLCAEAEEAAREERLDAVAGILPLIEVAYDDALRWLRESGAKPEGGE